LVGEYDGAGVLIEETVCLAGIPVATLDMAGTRCHPTVGYRESSGKSNPPARASACGRAQIEWLGDIPVANLRPHTGGGVDIFYVHTDQLNTPRAVTRPSDNLVVWSWYSDPFGTDAANENPAGPKAFKYNLRFAGQIFDGQAGLHANGYRDCYDPAIGRYCQPDPIGLAGGSFSPYVYGSASPISRIDPLGLIDSIDSKIAAYIAQGNIQGLETLIESGGLSPLQEKLAQAGLQQIQILARGSSNISRLADAFRQSSKVIRRAIEMCKQEGLPRGGPIRNPDVVVDLTTGEVYPQLPSGGIGDSIGNLFDYLPKN
jgi:RHS repeat-associated protein